MTGFVAIIPCRLHPGLKVPFLTLSGAPTGVYYSINQCRIGRASPNRPAGLRILDSSSFLRYTSLRLPPLA